MLHLAPRSVRDLIYTGRLPSLRIGRLHYVRATDLELERRRRLGLPLPRRREQAATRPRRVSEPGVARPRPAHQAPRTDAALRRQRAAERAELVSRWAARHQPPRPPVPFEVVELSSPATCAACGRVVRQGQVVQPTNGPASQLCLACGRRALLDWADQRRLEASAARQMAHGLGVQPSAPGPGTLGAPGNRAA